MASEQKLADAVGHSGAKEQAVGESIATDNPKTASESKCWRSIVRISLFYVSCVVLLIVTASLAHAGHGVRTVLFIGTAGSLEAFLLSSLFVRWDGVRLEAVGAWPDRRSFPRLAFGFILGLLLVALTSAILGVVGHVQWVRTGTGNWTEAGLALIGFLALSCREELVFHGYPLRRLESRYGPWIAQLIVAVVFIVEHMAGGMAWGPALAGAGVGALLFGMAAIATRGLAVPIGIHAAWNFGDWMRSGGGKTANGFWKPVVQDGFEAHADVVGWIGYVSIMLLAALAFCAWYRSVRRRA
jgi:membrane protease YdiL (CAAX protease family)